ncbi:MAG TPA: GNAT family N-acetyltransferase [Aggregatilineales bacterium]|nr:GNAT family N-acetyltransferase [Aggregatilineales bacterium]
MIAPCEFLEWDTNFFQRRIGRATVSELDNTLMQAILTWCDDNKIDCLYFLSHPEHAVTAQLLTAHQFDFVDIRMTLEKTNIQDQKPFTPDVKIRPHQESDIPRLKQIASQSYRASRFYFDTHFPNALCDQFYEVWIEKSCSGYADMVLVCEINNQPAGFVTCSIKDGQGQIGLVGVDATTRGKGVGYQTLMASLQWFHDNNCQTIEVVTQGRNVTAQRLYQRCGFVTKSVELWYHFWTKNGK